MNIKNLFQLNTLLYVFPAVFMTIDHGGAFILLILFAMSLFTLIRDHRRVLMPLMTYERAFLKAIFFFIAVYVFNIWIFNSDISELDNAFQIILIVIIYLLMRTLNLETEKYYLSIFFAALSCFIIASLQKYSLNLGRSMGVTGIIAFGSMSMTIAIMSACIALLHHSLKVKYYGVICFFLGVSASVFSASRGAWLILLSCLMVIFILNPMNMSLKKRLLALLSMSVLIVSSYSYEPIKHRVDLAIKDVSAYVQKGDAQSSVGVRLELWRAALISASDNLWLGIGEGNFKNEMEKLIIQDKVDPYLKNMSHVNNEYLSALLHRGVLGLVSLLLVLLVPFVYFVKKIKSKKNDINILAALGVVVTTSAMTISLSDSYFLQHDNLLFYFSFICIIFSLMFSANQQYLKNHNASNKS